jgi:uncharacterized coiled-coil DUF342 family protein
MKFNIYPIIALVVVVMLGWGAISMFQPFINSKREVVTDIINVDQVKTDCKTKINNLTAKMEQFRNAYSQYGLRVKELTANASGSVDATKKINESALGLIWSNKSQSVQDTVKSQATAYNNLMTTLPQLQQQFQGADQQLYKEISQEIRTGRNKLEQIGNELISSKTDFKNYLEKKTKYNINDGGSQIINIYQYNGCIPTARGTNNIEDAYKWIDDKFFTPVSQAAAEAFDSKVDKPVL